MVTKEELIDIGGPGKPDPKVAAKLFMERINKMEKSRQ